MTKNNTVLLLLIFLFLFLFATAAHARALDEVNIQKTSDGYDISINFLLSMQFQSLAPQDASKEFFAQLHTLNFQNLTAEEVESLSERFSPSWDPQSGIPMQELTYDGSDPERPQLTLRFTEDVEITMRSSADLKSLIISVKILHPAVSGNPEPETEQPPIIAENAVAPETPETNSTIKEEKVTEVQPTKPEPSTAESPETKEGSAAVPPKVITPENNDLASLMEEARECLTLNEYDRAILLYTKILQKADGETRQQAQEFLGLAYERNKQIAHAKDEYEKYLQEYPKGPDSNRVRQRLAGLITAERTPLAALPSSKRAATDLGTGKKPKWSYQNFGNLSQFYYRDQTKIQGSKTQVNRNDLSTDIFLNSKIKSDNYDFNVRFSEGRQQNFIEGQKSHDSLSAASLEVKNKPNGLYGRFGRQSLTSGGVLGRFDGVDLSSQINPIMKINGVFGFPVESVKNTTVKTNKKFYGLNVDWGPFTKSWNFNTFFINQTNDGYTDRRAIGGEARYFDPQKALYTLLDYDIYFNQINIFLMNGHLTLPTKTTLSLVLDYRKSPLLMTNNAIQGQGVSKLGDLSSTKSTSELKQLALDRTTNSKSVTAGITQDLKKDLQWTAEATASTTEGTVTSGGVEGSKEIRPDYFYLTQLISSNIFKENDVLIGGLSFNNTLANNTYSITLDERYPLTTKLHFIPKFRYDFRDNKQTVGNRQTFRPILHLDYDMTRWARLELEGGIEYVADKTSTGLQKSTELFVSSGYRLSF